MHLMLHIFKKDARRLQWAIALALLLQVAVAYFDATRNSAYPGAQEGWMTVLLLVTWACLIALAVHEDSLVGDRQFWISRPYRWPLLLGAKLLFAAAFVHVPSFLADAIILGARGFQPWQWIPHLLGKQLMLAAALTLPVMALAAVLQNSAQVALVAVAVSAIAINRIAFVDYLFQPPWLGALQGILLEVFLTALFGVSMAIVLWQFARRQTWRSRGVGIVAAVVFVLLFSTESSVFGALAAALGRPETRISIEPGPAPEIGTPDVYDPPSFRRDDRWVVLKLPLHVTGAPEGMGTYIQAIGLELAGPDGHRYTSDIESQRISPRSLLVRVRRPLFEKLKNNNVELKATTVAMLYRQRKPAPIPLESNSPVPGAGRCSNVEEESRGALGEVLIGLRVVCESPAGFTLPPFAGLSLSDHTGRGKILTESSPSLSPLDRTQTSFDVGQSPTKLHIEARTAGNWQVVKIDMRNLHLSDYIY